MREKDGWGLFQYSLKFILAHTFSKIFAWHNDTTGSTKTHTWSMGFLWLNQNWILITLICLSYSLK